MSVAARRVSLRYEVPWTHPSWVLEDEQVPESGPQDDASRTMDSLWREWARRTGRVVVIHRNLAVRWNPDDRRIGVDPDLALLEPPPATPGEQLTSLRTWEPGNHPPRVALEVVSAGNPEKDYLLGPRKHAAAGVGELWVFDPLRLGTDEAGPWRIQLWRRDEGGTFERVYAGDGPAWSDFFGAWLVVPPGGLLLRMSDDREGRSLWPTEAERAERERVAKERERVAKERALAACELERVAKERALAACERERDAKERALDARAQALVEKDLALARIAELEARLAAKTTGG
jgi:Uma2 family endonuclease